MSALMRFALWLYPRLALRLYPRRFREEFGEEMAGVFRQSVEDAAGDGWRAVLGVLGRELRDWPLSCLREHARERFGGRGRMWAEPPSSFLSGWGVVAAGMPFLYFSLSFLSFGLALPPGALLVFLGGGVLAAWLRGWPGWVVSWLGISILVSQTWLPYRLFYVGNDPALNAMPQLLSAMSEVAIQAGWLVVLYLVVRRWPRYGAMAFLPFLWLPFAFNMEFASQAMSALVMNAGLLIMALTAMAISRQRGAGGDVWLLYGGALLFGASQALGAARFSPGMESAWRGLAGDLMEGLAPAAAILLLQALNAWAWEKGAMARRSARLMAGGALLSYFALLALGRLIGFIDLEAFQLQLASLLAGVWLVGALLVVGGAWGLSPHFHGRSMGMLIVATLLAVLMPLLYRPSFLSMSANALTYQNPRLADLRAFVPTLQTAETVIFVAGLTAMLLLPAAISRLRRQTATFPMAPASIGLKGPWRERLWPSPRQAAAARARLRPSRRLVAPAGAGVLLVAGGIFFAAVFLPLQLEAEPYTQQVALGDLDGDGDLDAVLANTRRLLPTADNQLLTNDGRGRFGDSGRPIGQGGNSVALLDESGAGELSVAIGGMMGVSVYRYANNRYIAEEFSVSRTPESGASQWYLQAGDLNGDGFGDLFMAGCCGIGLSTGPGEMEWIPPANRVLLGSAVGLRDSGQELGVRGSQAVALGDLDGDGDLDAFVGNTQSDGENRRDAQPNEVWLNDGAGNLSDSGLLLGAQRTYAVALGDVDGDGDLDALVGNEGADELWLNEGDGRLRLSPQSWSSRRTLSVFLVDLDGDGDLDAVTAHQVSGSFAWWRQAIIWWNDGSGRFDRDDQGIRFRPNGALAVGDVNGDGLPDVVSGALDEMTVWLNDRNGRFSIDDQ